MKKDWRVCYVLIAPGYEITTLSLYFCFFSLRNISQYSVLQTHVWSERVGTPWKSVGGKRDYEEEALLVHYRVPADWGPQSTPIHQRHYYPLAAKKGKTDFPQHRLRLFTAKPERKKEFTRICYKRSELNRDFLCVQSNIIYVNISETVLFTVTHIWWCYMFFFLLYTNRSPPYKSH